MSLFGGDQKIGHGVTALHIRDEIQTILTKTCGLLSEVEVASNRRLTAWQLGWKEEEGKAKRAGGETT
jgi:hypothetical protein